ncbi:MAG: peroxidase family protein, partial [Gaiellaceae bacterium]
MSRPAARGWILGGLLIVAAAVTLARKGSAGGAYRDSLLWRLYNGASSWLDRKRGWDRLSTPLGLAALVGIRNVLRQRNLHDTNDAPTVDARPVPPFEARLLASRTADGTYNDLADPAMGRAGSRFGRNVPVDRTFPEPEPHVLEPSPRVVSRELLTRDPFQEATSVNALVAAWLQFMI